MNSLKRVLRVVGSYLPGVLLGLAGSAAFLFLLSCIVYRDIWYWTRDHLLSPFFWIAMVLAYFAAFASWRRARRSASESINRLYLITLGLILAGIASGANYALYTVGGGTYLIDSSLLDQLVSDERLAATQTVEDTERLVDLCARAAREVDPTEMPLPYRQRGWAARFFGALFAGDPELVATQPGSPEIVLRTIRGGTSAPIEVDVIDVRDASSSVRINPIQIATPIQRDGMTGRELGEALEKAQRYLLSDRDYLDALEVTSQERQDSDSRVPFRLFVYQNTMDLLGANPNYIRPMSGLTRLLAFVTALIKYCFLYIFLTELARAVHRPRAATA